MRGYHFICQQSVINGCHCCESRNTDGFSYFAVSVICIPVNFCPQAFAHASQ